MQKELKLKSYGKINLSLNITGVLGNLHTLDMVVKSINLYDDIFFKFNDSGKILVSYSDESILAGSDTVTKALNLVKQKLPDLGCEVFIDKKIPLGGGLGGSSANAATVLNLFVGAGVSTARNLTLSQDEIFNIAKQVGSDVPYMLTGGFARIGGTGDKCEFFESGIELNIVIAKGKGGVNSGESYKEFDKMYSDKKYSPSDNDKLITALKNGDGCGVINNVGNALTKASLVLNPHIQKTLEELENFGALKTIMSGSGSCCIGIFESQNDAALAVEKLQGKGYWACLG